MRLDIDLMACTMDPGAEHGAEDPLPAELVVFDLALFVAGTEKPPEGT